MKKTSHSAPSRQITLLLEAIQDIREQRKKEYKRGEHPEGKTFSWQDLDEKTQFVCKNLRVKRVRYRLPSRESIIAIIEYLECNTSECNYILKAAEYAPIEEFLTGMSLDVAMKPYEEELYLSKEPAYIINRDWSIHLWNGHFLTLFGIPEFRARSIPLEELNVLDLIFNSNSFPFVRRRLSRSIENWNAVAKMNILGFKQENSLCEREKWYINLVSQLKVNYGSEFLTQWSGPKTEQLNQVTDYVTELQSTTNKPLRYRSIISSLGIRRFPQLVVCRPVDDESRQVFTELGLAVLKS